MPYMSKNKFANKKKKKKPRTVLMEDSLIWRMPESTIRENRFMMREELFRRMVKASRQCDLNRSYPRPSAMLIASTIPGVSLKGACRGFGSANKSAVEEIFRSGASRNLRTIAEDKAKVDVEEIALLGDQQVFRVPVAHAENVREHAVTRCIPSSVPVLTRSHRTYRRKHMEYLYHLHLQAQRRIQRRTAALDKVVDHFGLYAERSAWVRLLLLQVFAARLSNRYTSTGTEKEREREKYRMLPYSFETAETVSLAMYSTIPFSWSVARTRYGVSRRSKFSFFSSRSI